MQDHYSIKSIFTATHRLNTHQSWLDRRRHPIAAAPMPRPSLALSSMLPAHDRAAFAPSFRDQHQAKARSVPASIWATTPPLYPSCDCHDRLLCIISFKNNTLIDDSLSVSVIAFLIQLSSSLPRLLRNNRAQFPAATLLANVTLSCTEILCYQDAIPKKVNHVTSG